jgi:hypothetical protein
MRASPLPLFALFLLPFCIVSSSSMPELVSRTQGPCVCNWGDKCTAIQTELAALGMTHLVGVKRVTCCPTNANVVALRSVIADHFKLDKSTVCDGGDYFVAFHHWPRDLVEDNLIIDGSLRARKKQKPREFTTPLSYLDAISFLPSVVLKLMKLTSDYIL